MSTINHDEKMRAAVSREIEWDPRVDSGGIDVSAKDGAVALSGRVRSYSERRAAISASERVFGVRAVADKIEVRIPGTGVRDDADIAGEITRLMHANTAIPVAVTAEVSKGHVSLRGDVEWAYQRAEAERAIRYLAGVHNVSNLIKLTPRPVVADDVKERVSEAIARMADLDSRSIWVTSSNGTVHLHGHVHSLSEWRTAGRAAESAPGVGEVENAILVTA